VNQFGVAETSRVVVASVFIVVEPPEGCLCEHIGVRTLSAAVGRAQRFLATVLVSQVLQ
jgi:hypothetical protein